MFGRDKRSAIATGSYLQLDLRGEYQEGPPGDVLTQLVQGEDRSLLSVVGAIRNAKADDRVAGLILRIGHLSIGWAKAQDLRDAIRDFRTSNKPTIALLENETAAANLEYYVAVAAERVYLSPTSTAPLSGLAAQYMFFGGLWDKIDVEMQVEKIREYKTMGDTIAFKEMTPAHREMANSLLDSIDAQFVAAVAEARKLEPAAVRAIIDKAPVSPRDFQDLGLSDGTKFLQTLHDEQGGDQTPLISLDDYEHVDAADLGLSPEGRIAVIYGVGSVHAGEERGGMSSDVVAEALKEAADDETIDAIVFRIDSPGGSALASDTIWRATRYVRTKKPLVVSMSDVAGSGGYFVAAGATKIVAQPATYTGSIGVVMVRPSLKKALASLGIHTETLTRGKFAQLGDLSIPLDNAGRAKVVEGLEHVYREFIDRVAAGRSMSPEKVDEVGRGRVWTGEQAKERGLIDELGGFHKAIEVAKKEAGLSATVPAELVFLPRDEGLRARLAHLLGTSSGVRLPRVVQELVDGIALAADEGTFLTHMHGRVEIR